jgi:hypothetical protein
MKTQTSNGILAETVQTRAEAQRVLEQLKQDMAALDANATGRRGEDAMRIVTGRTAIERAIDSSRRMIDHLDRTIERANSLTAVDVAAGDRHGDAHDDALRVETVQAALARLKAASSVPTA